MTYDLSLIPLTNRVRREQFELLYLVVSLETEQLEYNSFSYLVWLGISKQNRVRTEQIELLDLLGRLKTEQS